MEFLDALQGTPTPLGQVVLSNVKMSGGNGGVYLSLSMRAFVDTLETASGMVQRLQSMWVFPTDSVEQQIHEAVKEELVAVQRDNARLKSQTVGLERQIEELKGKLAAYEVVERWLSKLSGVG